MITIGSGFQFFGSTDPNFSRDKAATLADLKAVGVNDIDRGHIVFCDATGKHYVFRPTGSETLDDSTGYFRELKVGSDLKTYIANVTVSELTASSLTPAVVTKLIALRGNYSGNNLVLLPYTTSSDCTCTPAIVAYSGSSFQMVFYYSNALYTVNGDSQDQYTVTKTEFALKSDLTGKQDTLVSGTNIKTINNTSLLGSGNINIQGGSGNIYKAAVTVNALTSSTWPSGTMDALNAMRAELQGYDLVLLPDSDYSQVTCTPAVVVENGSTFRMVFYDGNALYTLTATTSDSWAITKQEFLVGTTEPAANAIELNNIMLMFDLPKSQHDFYDEYAYTQIKHYFVVIPPASANIQSEEDLALWLTDHANGEANQHISIKYDNGKDAGIHYNTQTGRAFIITADNDLMFNVTIKVVEDNSTNYAYMCEMVPDMFSGPSAWESINIV